MKSGHAHLDALVSLLLRLALTSAAVIVSGTTRLLNPLGLTVLAGLGLVALWASGSLGQLDAAFQGWLSQPRPRGWAAVVLSVCTAVVVVRLLAQVWLFAPYAGDALSYHLPKIA